MAREPASRGRRPAGKRPEGGEQARAPAEVAVREADVIVDVEFGDGLLFLVLANLGDRPAHGVRVKFDPSFRGLGGSRPIGSLALFRRLEFLAPQKRIRLFLDRAASYFARGEPTALEATISWRTGAGERRTQVVRHDLEIYRDLPYIEREVPRHADPA